VPTWLNLHSILDVLVLVLGGLIRQSIKAPRDSERASLLTILAESAAAATVNLSGNAAWSQLVRDTVARIAAESTVPTTNAQKLEAAAITALMKLGKSPQAVAPAQPHP
jgi:hypothetical protein